MDLRQMMTTHAGPGRLDWIGLRPARRAEMRRVREARIEASGLTDDHARPGKRAVTLIQGEHLPVIAALLGRARVVPEDLRRNLLVTGINLAALRRDVVRIGAVRFRIEGPCPPCSRMEEVFGPGGYSAVRGHGGWYASVETPGRIALGNPVWLDP